MKLERRICDLCGGTIKKSEPHGTLSVPDYAKLAKRDAKKKSVEDDDASGYRVFFAPIFSDGNQTPTKEYDACKGCIEGLMRARELVRMKREQFLKALA